MIATPFHYSHMQEDTHLLCPRVSFTFIIVILRFISFYFFTFTPHTTITNELVIGDKLC